MRPYICFRKPRQKFGQILVRFAAVAAGPFIYSTGPAIAADNILSREILAEIQFDDTRRADNSADKRHDLFATIEPRLSLYLTPGWSAETHLTVAPMRAAAPGEDRHFKDHGLIVEQLHLRYESGAASAVLGKFTPNFGIAWHMAPGIHGTDFAEDGYELAERIGAEIAYRFSIGGTGHHRLTGAAFFADTVLNASVPRRRMTASLGDGGPGNTQRPNSFAAALDGTVPGAKQFSYHAAIVDQAKGSGNDADETGIALGVHGEVSIGMGVSITPLIEWVRLMDADGGADQRRDFVTAGLGISWRVWNWAASYTGRQTKAGGADVDDWLYQLSAGYMLGAGWQLDLGWRGARENGEGTGTLGLRLAYHREF